jgi:hypothetical protein
LYIQKYLFTLHTLGGGKEGADGSKGEEEGATGEIGGTEGEMEEERTGIVGVVDGKGVGVAI